MPLSGETLFDSEKHIDLPPQKRRALFPHMNVVQNIEAGMGKRPDRSRTESLIRQFQLEGLEKKYPAQLSGGQQQRTALLRAVPARKSAGKRGTRRENDRSVQHPHGQMPVLQVKVK